MNTKLSLLLSVCALLLFAACEKTVTFDSQWKDSNEAQFLKIERNTAEYTKLESQSKNGYIMYKEIKAGNSGKRPYFTDQVKVLYTGWYKEFWTRNDTFTGDDGNIFRNKVIFYSSAERNNIPSLLKINDTRYPDGFGTALQHMEVGDKWEVWIPWQLGYGASGRGDIKGYTTMVFEIEMIEIL